jgi:hypothetical protein
MVIVEPPSAAALQQPPSDPSAKRPSVEFAALHAYHGVRHTMATDAPTESAPVAASQHPEAAPEHLSISPRDLSSLRGTVQFCFGFVPVG